MQQKQLLVALAIAIPLAAMVLAAVGFKGRNVIIGFDLGTTYSTVAYRSNGELHIMRNSLNDSTTASLIAVENGKFIFGKPAKEILLHHPSSCIFDSKRVIGRRWDDVTLIAENERHGGRLIPHPTVQRDVFGKVKQGKSLATCRGCEAEAAFILRVSDEASQAAKLAQHKCIEPGSHMTDEQLRQYLLQHALVLDAVNASSLHGQYLLVTPTAAACLLVTHLMESVIAELGHSQIKSVVITVPAEFNAAQREATVDAYTRAGYKPSRILHEPAAAAIAYGLHQRAEVKYVLVFDMGGGTLDISILYAQDGAFTVLGAGGDTHLGGEDFDDCLLQVIKQQLEKERRTSHPLDTTTDALNWFPCEDTALRKSAEEVKIKFGRPDVNEAQWTCFDGKRVINGTITRDDFNQQCDSLFQRTLEPIEAGLYNANLEVKDIDEVVLVGGSSRLLRVRDILQQHFGKAIRNTVDPDLAVAVGASMVVD